LKQFYRAAEPRLAFPIIWFDDAKRQAAGVSFARVVASLRYTVWACAVLNNHAHLCVRRHRDDPAMIWRALAEEAGTSLRRFADVSDDHPFWSNRPYKVYLKTSHDVKRVVAYVEQNPPKERIPAQSWSFVSTYDGWPYAQRASR